MSDGGARLARRLGLADATVIGVGAMVGAGIFAAIGPAAAAAGSGVLLALLAAATVAICNALATAQLAAVHPEAGGVYAYGRSRLGAWWGYVAGWGFVVGKTASCAAMALTFGAYALPAAPRLPAVIAVVALAAANANGVRNTVAVTRITVAVVLTALAAVLIAAFAGGSADPANLTPFTGTGARGLLTAAGLWFFAFAGYARIATLGEEVVAPERTIPRAILTAFAVVLLVYLAVAAAALAVVGADGLADAAAPLLRVVTAGDLAALAPAVRIGAVVGSLGVLLSLLAGVARTAFAMARDRELPASLARVHPRHGVPAVAEWVVAALVVAVVVAFDVRDAIGFSAFCVLVYYGVANVAAWTLPAEQRRWPRALSVLGALGCAVLAVSLPPTSVAGGAGVLVVGAVVRGVTRWAARRRDARRREH